MRNGQNYTSAYSSQQKWQKNRVKFKRTFNLCVKLQGPVNHHYTDRCDRWRQCCQWMIVDRLSTISCCTARPPGFTQMYTNTHNGRGACDGGLTNTETKNIEIYKSVKNPYAMHTPALKCKGRFTPLTPARQTRQLCLIGVGGMNCA